MRDQNAFEAHTICDIMWLNYTSIWECNYRYPKKRQYYWETKHIWWLYGDKLYMDVYNQEWNLQGNLKEKKRCASTDKWSIYDNKPKMNKFKRSEMREMNYIRMHHAT